MRSGYMLGQCLSVEQVPCESIRILRHEIQIEKAHLRGISYSLKGMFKLIIVFFCRGGSWNMKSIMLLLLLLSHFSHVQLCATPWTAAYQASPSMGFSRQEHWSGLPFPPPPMHENEKWKGSRSVMPDSVRPHGLQPTRLLRPWDFPGKSTGVGYHCLLPQRFTSNLYLVIAQRSQSLHDLVRTHSFFFLPLISSLFGSF